MFKSLELTNEWFSLHCIWEFHVFNTLVAWTIIEMEPFISEKDFNNLSGAFPHLVFACYPMTLLVITTSPHVSLAVLSYIHKSINSDLYFFEWNYKMFTHSLEGNECNATDHFLHYWFQFMNWELSWKLVKEDYLTARVFININAVLSWCMIGHRRSLLLNFSDIRF